MSQLHRVDGFEWDARCQAGFSSWMRVLSNGVYILALLATLPLDTSQIHHASSFPILLQGTFASDLLTVFGLAASPCRV